MNLKKVLILIPLVILVVSILLAEGYRQSYIPGTRPNGETLELLGYNYNRQLVQLSISLWNRGNEHITITEVVYDGIKLNTGLIGSAVDLAAFTENVGYEPEDIVPTNDLIFAAADHWNMNTIGSGSPTIQPNGMASLYLGVTADDPGSVHVLSIVAGADRYVFTLEYKGN